MRRVGDPAGLVILPYRRQRDKAIRSRTSRLSSRISECGCGDAVAASLIPLRHSDIRVVTFALSNFGVDSSAVAFVQL